MSITSKEALELCARFTLFDLSTLLTVRASQMVAEDSGHSMTITSESTVCTVRIRIVKKRVPRAKKTKAGT